MTSATEPIDAEDLEATTILVSVVAGVRLSSQIAQAIMIVAPEPTPAFLAERVIGLSCGEGWEKLTVAVALIRVESNYPCN